MHDKVFISYAKEDYSFAEKLYNFLLSHNYKPWIDKKGILPGQDWNYTIRKALREANYIIILLSNISVQKRGYVQREFRLALNYYEEKLEDDIYLIPLKINECNIPEQLSKFQWIEYKSKDCFDLILQSLETQRQKYINLQKDYIAAKETFSYKEFEDNYEYGVSTKFKIQTTYFQFDDESHPSLKELNKFILGKNTESIIAIRASIFELNNDLIKLDFDSNDWDYQNTYNVNLITKSMVSFIENQYSFCGGAHGNSFVKAWNFNLNPLFKIKIGDLFEYDDEKDVLKFLSKYCYDNLRRIYNEFTEISQDEIKKQKPNTLFFKDSLSPKWENFKNFLISKNGLEIIFNTYTLSGYAFGLQIILVPFDELLKVLKKPYRLKLIIEKVK